MNWMRFVLAAIGGYIALFGVGAVWHLLLFPGYYSAVMTTMQAALGGILVLDALRALVLAYIYPIGYKGGDVWMEGFKFGVLMGLLAGFAAGIYLGIVGQPMSMVGSELGFSVIQGAINGVVVGLIYGKQAAPAK